MRSAWVVISVLLVVSGGASAIAAPDVERVTSAATSYTCTYRASGLAVFATLSGRDNTLTRCRAFGRNWGRRWYGNVPGTVKCIFQDDTARVTMKLRGSDARLACVLLEPRLTLWTRTL